MKKILVSIFVFATLAVNAQIIPFATSQLTAYNTSVYQARYTIAGTCIRTIVGGNFSITGTCLNSSLTSNSIVASTCAGTIAGSNYTVSGVCLGTLTGTAYATVAGVSIYRYNGVVTNRIYLTSASGINVAAADYANQGVNVLVSSYDLATTTVPTVAIYKNSGLKLSTVFSGTQTSIGGGSSVTGASFVDSGNLYVQFSNGSILLYNLSGLKLKKIK